MDGMALVSVEANADAAQKDKIYNCSKCYEVRSESSSIAVTCCMSHWKLYNFHHKGHWLNAL